MTDRTHDPNLRSWVESANIPGCDFPIQNLPFATFRHDSDAHVGVAIGDQVLDVTRALDIPSLRSVMALPKSERVALRQRISKMLSEDRAAPLVPVAGGRTTAPLRNRRLYRFLRVHPSRHQRGQHVPTRQSAAAELQMAAGGIPWARLFYRGERHGCPPSMGPDRRAARRPAGLRRIAPPGLRTGTGRLPRPRQCAGRTDPARRRPVTNCSASACSTTGRRAMCKRGSISRSARSWRRISPPPSRPGSSPWKRWNPSAARPSRVPPATRSPLPHLRTEPNGAYGITLEVWLRSARMAGPMRVSRSQFASLYWTLSQMVAHHASNGCPLRPGSNT